MNHGLHKTKATKEIRMSTKIFGVLQKNLTYSYPSDLYLPEALHALNVT